MLKYLTSFSKNTSAIDIENKGPEINNKILILYLSTNRPKVRKVNAEVTKNMQSYIFKKLSLKFVKSDNYLI